MHRAKRIRFSWESTRTGLLEIRCDAIAQKLLIDPVSGQATGVSFVDRKTRKEHKVYGKAVMLCASAIESVRILLNSAYPKGDVARFAACGIARYPSG